MDWESVLARLGKCPGTLLARFGKVAEVAVRGAKARINKNGMVEWEVVVALLNTLESLPEENEGE